MTNQPHEKPEWFEHIADASGEKSTPINRVKKNRVAPALAIIAIALSATAYGLSKSPSDAETPTASQVSANLNSQDQVATPPNVSNPAPLPKIPAPTVPNGARGGDDDGEENQKRPGHEGVQKSGDDDNEGDDD
jgi:hypothetical protein